jgi:DNA polymerase-3 subunit alpha
MTALAERYISVFGRENFFLEVQVLDPKGMPACQLIAEGLRHVAKKLRLECVATADSHYVERRDAEDQRVLLCSKLRTTLSDVRRRIEAEEEVELGGFFGGDHFHIPTPEEVAVHHRPREMEMALRIAAMCEDYDILSQPRLPAFPCPDGLDESAYLRQLCEAGFDRLIVGREDRLDRPVSEYRDRIEDELRIFDGVGLSPYFLVVQHCTSYGRSRGWLLGPGRGSGAGCLLGYLLGITAIDPLPYGLMVERFYNAGRNKPGHVSLPDYDLDFTKIIPDRARITEELQAIQESLTEEEVAAGKSASIIGYALDVYADELSEWAQMADDGTVTGDFAPYFEQAMRLEGTKKNVSTHAAGVVISSTPLSEVCPLTYDEATDSYQAAMEYPALEAMGLVKLDLLGIAMLNKGEGVREMARHGEIREVAA